MTPRRIGLLGGECTGKTTLALALADALPAFVADEYLRDFVRDFGRLPTAADQEGIYLTQQMTVRTVERAAAFADVPWIIADPLPLMTAVYSVVYFGDDSLIEAGIADASTYDLVLWCDADVPWEAEDGMRDGVEFRERAGEVIADIVTSTLTVHCVSGTAEERLASALRIVDGA